MNTRIGVASKQHQGAYKRVLCVCSGGLLRSPTAAFVLSQSPFHYNTRSCGIEHYALIGLDSVLLSWADEIVVMEEEHEQYVRERLPVAALFGRKEPPVIRLDIPDIYRYRSSCVLYR